MESDRLLVALAIMALVLFGAAILGWIWEGIEAAAKKNRKRDIF